MRTARFMMAAAVATMSIAPAIAAPGDTGKPIATAGWSLSAGPSAADGAEARTSPDQSIEPCASATHCTDDAKGLSRAKSARASTPTPVKNKAMGSGILIAVLAAAAVIAGIVVVSK